MPFHVPVNRVTLFVAGVLSGIFGTVAAIGGPPIVLLMHGFSPDRMRGNLAAFFRHHLAVDSGDAGAGRGSSAHGISSWHCVLPAVLVGNALADAVAHRLDKVLLQRCSLALCTLAALGLLL